MKTTHLSRAVVGIAFVLSASWTWADVSLGSLERTATGVVFRNGNVRRALEFYGPNTVRVKTDLGWDHWKHPSLAVIAKPRAVAYAVSETPEALLVKGPAFTVRIDRASGAVSFVEGEKTLLAELAESVTITEKDVDGEPTYEVTQRWTPAEGEGLYGLGQAASGKLNLRGQRIKIVQTNIPAFSPVWSSSKGYMILWDVYSQSVFHDQADGLSLWSESAPGGSDYSFMYGADPNRRFAEYRMLTGAATLFPKATFGYFQSKERYRSAQELVDIVGRFRKEGFLIDWIVQDWQYLELLARWNQFAIFNPIYRWHVSSPVAKEPFRARERHPEYYASFLAAAKLRYRLLPYIYSLARDVHETGRPFVRPAWIDFPSTPDVNDDQTSIVCGKTEKTVRYDGTRQVVALSSAASSRSGRRLGNAIRQ